jgi:hypothetical protein
MFFYNQKNIETMKIGEKNKKKRQCKMKKEFFKFLNKLIEFNRDKGKVMDFKIQMEKYLEVETNQDWE